MVRDRKRLKEARKAMRDAPRDSRSRGTRCRRRRRESCDTRRFIAVKSSSSFLVADNVAAVAYYNFVARARDQTTSKNKHCPVARIYIIETKTHRRDNPSRTPRILEFIQQKRIFVRYCGFLFVKTSIALALELPKE